MLNPDQQDYVNDLNSRPRADICPCGWYLEKDCVKKCVTGTRESAPMLVHRIQTIYRQIDAAKTK